MGFLLVSSFRLAILVLIIISAASGCYATIERGVYPASWRLAGLISDELVHGYDGENAFRIAVIVGDPPAFPDRPETPEFVSHLRLAGHYVAFIDDPDEAVAPADFDLVVRYRSRERVWQGSKNARLANLLTIGIVPLYSDSGAVWELECGRDPASLEAIESPELHDDFGGGWFPWIKRAFSYERADKTPGGFRRLAETPEERGRYFHRNLANALIYFASKGGCLFE